jgi:hypothetical protein
MNSPVPPSRAKLPDDHIQPGFALVVTLSLMILLTVIAVGLLTLSSISLRSSSNATYVATAKSNARLSLMMALGELQRTAGLDTRVTARADILDDSHPPVLGVWKSWEGTDHSTDGRPLAPDYANHKQARFLQWLTSASLEAGINDVPNTTAGTAKAILLGEGTVGKEQASARQIQLEPTKIRTATNTFNGAMAWWIGGENQKARLPRPYAPANDSPAAWSVVSKTHSVADPKPFGLDTLLDSADLKDPTAMTDVSKVTSLHQADFLRSVGGDKISRKHYHDLSASSMGLLTNTATGGWRKDLSLLTETWSNQATSRLPLFRVLPERDFLYNRPSSPQQNSLLYYWSNYRSNPGGGNAGIYQFPAIGSWENLVNYATFHKRANASAGVMSVNAEATNIDGNPFTFASNVRMLPLLARVQWIYSHQSSRYQPKAGEPTSPVKYNLQLLVQPVVTLWNPYNVKLTTQALSFSLLGTLPPLIDYKINGVSQPKKVTLQGANRTSDATVAYGYADGSNYRITSPFTLNPGETRVFSARSAPTVPVAGTADVELVPGFSLGKGILADVSTALGANTYAKAFAGTSTISTAVSFISEYNDAGAIGVGLYLDMRHGSAGSPVLAYRMTYDNSTVGGAYKPIEESKFQKKTFLEVEGATRAVPFLCVTFGARMASNTHMPSKGFVQSSPFVNYTAMGKKAMVESTISYQYPGTLNNVNSPFEFSFQPLLENSPFMPNVSDTSGFIVTGFTSQDGLKRCVISELPGRPLNSLPELQNWDARFENPVPPYSYYLVGNSDASPLFPSNAAFNENEKKLKGAENLQHDDSYCLNHVLFDDWFFSSIAPEAVNFGKAGSSTVSAVYKNLLQDPSKPLMNRAYKPLPQDVAAAAQSTAALNNLASSNVGTTGWKTIASRLEVEGMFNVNSTSVTAWRALLGHARDQKIPYMDASGIPQLSAKTDYAFSRFSVAGEGDNSSGRGGEFAGYRVFTESQLDYLAEQIVDQVRKRGPFLSLAEFVNRQLSSDKDLALSGAVQTALNQLAKSGMNPFSQLENNTPVSDASGISYSSVATGTPPGGASGYKFAEAAVGHNIYGLPGWTRQADVLRGIAPILSARDDTFTIRGYGDARDASGREIKASAVCEATIRRTRSFVDPADDAASSTLSGTSGAVPAKRPVNERFGRRFEIVSFRWVAQDEI